MASAVASKDKSASIPVVDTTGDTPVLWYSTGLTAGDLVDCQLHPPQLEMTVTGHTRRVRDPKRPQLGMSVVIDGQDVVLFRYGSRIFATGSRCPHMRGLIAGGDIEDLAKHGGPPKTQKRLHRAQSIGVDADFDDHVFASTEAKPKARLCITCPVHGFQFDTDTGVSIMPPDSFHLPVFRVRIAGTVGRDTASAPAALAVPAHAPGPAPAPAAEVTAGGDARAGGTLSGEIEVGMTDFDPEAADADF